MIVTEHIATHYAADFDPNRLSLVQVQSLCPVTSCNMRMSTDAYYDVSIVSQFADIIFEVLEVDIHEGTHFRCTEITYVPNQEYYMKAA